MPDLYRLAVGPVNAAYYQKQFQRFESLGKSVPSWNHAAGFCTLAWLLMRKLWRPAGAYAGLLAGLLLVWWLGIHGRVPLPVEVALCLVAAVVLCAVPGFLGNGLYYEHIRNLTINTLGKASSLTQARVILTENAPTKERMQVATAAQALIALAAAGMVGSQLDFSAPAAPSPVVASGPPNIVIPSVESLRQTQAPATPADAASPADAALPAIEIAPSPEAPQPPTAPAPEAVAAVADAASAFASAPSSVPTSAATATAATTPEEDLSIVQFAKAVPAAGADTAAATAITTAATVATAAATTAATAAAAPAPQPPSSTPVAAAAPAANQAAPAAQPAEDNIAAAKQSVAAAAPAKTAKTTAAPAPAKTPKAAKPTNTATTAQSAPKGSSNRLVAGKFYVNAGVYAQASNVNNNVRRLQAANLNTVRQTVTGNRGELTRLRVGPFDTRKQAEQAAQRVKRLNIETSIYQHPK